MPIASRVRPFAVAAVLLVAPACSGPGASSSRTTSAPTIASTSTPTPSTVVGAGTPAARAEQAYLWGYPLLVTVRTFQLLASFAGTNRLFWQTSLSSPSLRVIVAPNHDTIYSLAVLDLRAGPMSLTVPRITGRYYTYQMLDAWMSTFGYVGTRATGGRTGRWTIVPPGWRGTLPAGVHRVDAPTDQVLMLGRFAAAGDADVARVLALRGQVQLTQDRAGVTTVAPIGRPRGRPQAVGAGDDPATFDELGDDLVANPPTSPTGRRLLAGFASLGIGIGRHPSTAVGSAARAALVDGIRRGNLAVAQGSVGIGQLRNGWRVTLGLGALGDGSDLRARAVVARYFWGPNVPAEAVYPAARTSSDGRPLTGADRYVIHFAKGGLPPVGAFWSITLYGPDMFLVANPLGRYSIGSQTAGLRPNPDGSLDVEVQAGPPADGPADWLPAPRGPFNLVMRLYLPRAPILDGTYPYPAIRRR